MTINNNINTVTLLGVLFSDPVYRFTQNGKEIANFLVKTSDSYKVKMTGEEKEIFEIHPIVIMLDTTIRNCKSLNLQKGDKVYLEGMLKGKKWKVQNSSNYNSTESEDKSGYEISISNFSHKLLLISKSDLLTSGSSNNFRDERKNYGSIKDHLDDDIPF